MADKAVITRDKPKDHEVAKAYFEGKIKEEHMTAHQKEYLDRIIAIHAMLAKQFKSKFFIVKKLKKLYGVSQATAYLLIRETERHFGDLNKSNKDIHRHIAIEMAKEAYRIAREDRDAKSMVAAIRAYSEATGLNQYDPDLPDFDKIQPSLNLVVLPEGMESHILEVLKDGAINLNEPPKVIDVEHEEIDTGGINK